MKSREHKHYEISSGNQCMHYTSLREENQQGAESPFEYIMIKNFTNLRKEEHANSKSSMNFH